MELCWRSLLSDFAAACATLGLVLACVAFGRAFLWSKARQGLESEDEIAGGNHLARFANLGWRLFPHWLG